MRLARIAHQTQLKQLFKQLKQLATLTRCDLDTTGALATCVRMRELEEPTLPHVLIRTRVPTVHICAPLQDLYVPDAAPGPVPQGVQLVLNKEPQVPLLF